MLLLFPIVAALLHTGKALPSLTAKQTNDDLSKYVNLFLGTEGGGNMFPGVVPEPFAMVKLGPDVDNGTVDAYSGYLPGGKIYGFSMMHESGTGGAPKYGVVSQMPVDGAVDNPLVDLGVTRAAPDTAAVGSYHAALANGITIDLAGSQHAGLYQYSFTSTNGSIVVDVSHVLPSFRGLGWGQNYAGGSFHIFNDSHYEGSGTYNNGWNLAPDWTIYFCGYFGRPVQSWMTFTGNGTTLSFYDQTAQTNGSLRQGGVFSFAQSDVTSRVGISFISSQQACGNVNNEIPSGSTIDSLASASKDKWNAEVFAKVTTTSTNQTMLTQLYSYLYGMHLLPSNRTGENPLWSSTEPYYDDIFTFWDLSRCSTALMHILQPTAYTEQIRSLIDIWRHASFLPDARSSNFNGRTQGGSNADTVLADAYVKGVRDGVDWTDGFAAMRTDAEVVPPPNNDPISPDSSDQEGRGALPDWLQYGYITPTFNRAVSRAMEYSGNDFALYQVATGLGLDAASTYLNRSRNWRNHWNAKQTSLGFSGFVVPRYANGSFDYPYDPLQCGGCYWGDPFYEGLPWEYSFNAHHDLATMISRSGGPDTFTARLETLFAPNITTSNAAFGGSIFNPGNEPSFTSPYLFNFVNRQDRSVYHAHSTAVNYYGVGTTGLPGNSDAGAMQTWILWNMIGLYPLTGQTTFLIGSPWFESLAIDLGGGKTLEVLAEGVDLESSYYVQRLKVNGKDWDKGWVTWEDVFADGGKLDFVLGPEVVNWTTGDLPPSPASEDLGV